LGFHQKQSVGFARLGFSGLVIALALAGVAAAAWQSFGPVDAAGCSLTLADRIVQATTLDIRLPFLFSATANCDEANVPLLGIPFAVWSMLTFAIIALLMMIASKSTSTSTLFRNPSD
jgi:disulfide bond formation protein DsbB